MQIEITKKILTFTFFVFIIRSLENIYPKQTCFWQIYYFLIFESNCRVDLYFHWQFIVHNLKTDFSAFTIPIFLLIISSHVFLINSNLHEKRKIFFLHIIYSNNRLPSFSSTQCPPHLSTRSTESLFPLERSTGISVQHIITRCSENRHQPKRL